MGGSKVCKKSVSPNRSKRFCIFSISHYSQNMTQPLALVFYEKLMPGSQLVNRLPGFELSRAGRQQPGVVSGKRAGRRAVAGDCGFGGRRRRLPRHRRIKSGCRHSTHSDHRVCRRAGDGVAGRRANGRRNAGGRRGRHRELLAAAFESGVASIATTDCCAKIPPKIFA